MLSLAPCNTSVKVAGYEWKNDLCLFKLTEIVV